MTYSLKNNARQLIATALFALACGSAMAQWQWVDATGRKVYSDTAPPSDIPEKNILKRPHKPSPAQTDAAKTAPSAETKAAGVPAPSGVDTKLEAKRKAAEKAEAAKKKAENEARNQARAENCERAKRSLSTLSSGMRIRTTNSKGEPDVMDEATLAAEVRRVEDVVRKDCSPAAASNSGPTTNATP